jgi:hypothetical protein
MERERERVVLAEAMCTVACFMEFSAKKFHEMNIALENSETLHYN